MNEFNFLPVELREKRLKIKRNSLNRLVIFMLFINSLIFCDILLGLHNSNINSKPIYINKKKTIDEAILKHRLVSFEFFEKEINQHFIYDEIDINGSQITMKFSTKDKDGFTKNVMAFEAIGGCSIQYLIAPYNEAEIFKFEIGLEVTK